MRKSCENLEAINQPREANSALLGEFEPAGSGQSTAARTKEKKKNSFSINQRDPRGRVALTFPSVLLCFALSRFVLLSIAVFFSPLGAPFLCLLVLYRCGGNSIPLHSIRRHWRSELAASRILAPRVT